MRNTRLTGQPSVRWLLTAVALSALLLACSAPRLQLNSERIAARYGSYEVRVLQEDDTQRISSLQSDAAGSAVTRTLAITKYADIAPAIADVAADIRAGASIGSTFRDAGWMIEKPTLFIGTLPVEADFQVVAQLMDVKLPVTLAMHAYRFDVSRNTERYHYATIVELHHPDYLQAADLRQLYRSPLPEQAPAESALLSDTRRVLLELSRSPTP